MNRVDAIDPIVFGSPIQTHMGNGRPLSPAGSICSEYLFGQTKGVHMLSGTTAYVTGASQGIGRQIAFTLADHGANVALAARSGGIHETADLIDAEERVLAVETDVTDEGSVQFSIEATIDRFGGFDSLVNNAGVEGPSAPIETQSLADARETMDVNLFGMFRTVKHAVPRLRESDRASIINISSIAGKRPLVNRTPYVASGMAIIGFTRTLAFELGPYGITVNAICPGATRGPRIDESMQDMAEKLDISFEEANRRIAKNNPLETLMEPEDTAEMVAYLASGHARHITAQDINVDAGAAWY